MVVLLQRGISGWTLAKLLESWIVGMYQGDVC